ncbi:von Willebrand factor type A domain-containing protein [Prosthecobacter debontii]|uniref:von Willebrand factor type A domain-containing protein n=1 Tax=Prosthecobacter debontii TaxID=48467 RepID=A0A1T4WLV3_9BACT|nr:VWA domain-containing protein [Prosthecobacter debontii]SKA77855.1 von Willebrand factor type A domain-containing protein [Prosthecobacter debontii]
MTFTTFTPLLWLLLLAVAGLAYGRSLVDRPSGLKIASFTLRVLGIVLLALALCQPYIRDHSDDAHVVFVVDVSQSVELKSALEALQPIEEGIHQLRTGDSYTLYTLAKGVREQKTPAELRTLLEGWQKGLADDAYRSESRLGDSLLSARLAFPAGKAKRLILFSDGVETDHSVTEALEQLQREDVDVRFVKLGSLDQPEAALVALESTSSFAFQGEMLRLNARVRTNRDMQATVRLLNKGVMVQEKTTSLKAGEEIKVPFDQEMITPGPGVWSAEIVPAQDHFPINNQASLTVNVQGQPRILVLHEKEREMRAIARALKEQDFEVDMRGKRGLPDSMEELLAFDAVVIANFPATDMTTRQMNLLRSYVADFGGGLVMLGSDNSFGLGGYYKTPVEEVLPLVSRYEKEKEKPSLAMVLVMDKSGSMQGEPIALARQAAKSAAELLSARDQIAVIGFDGAAQVVCDMTPASQLGTILAAIDSLEANGGTFMYPAMEAGRDMLERTSAKVKHMICLTDGQTQEADHIGLTQQMADSGITVSTIGLGQGAAADLLQQIAEVGHGRYYESNEAESLPQIFTKETTQASKSATQEGLFPHIQVSEHPMLAGYDADGLPVTLGYVMTEAKPAVQVLLTAENGDPLLAVGRFGLGMGLAYTGDLTEVWGGEWLAWDGCGRFWAQVLRGIVRKMDRQGLDTRSEISEGRWQVRLDRRDENETPLSGLRIEAQALDENGSAFPVQVEETGLGRYAAILPLGTRQHIALRLHDRDHDKLEVRHYHAAYPNEYRLDGQPAAPLTTLASYQPATLTAALPPAFQLRPIASWFAWLALVLLLGGILLRRV